MRRHRSTISTTLLAIASIVLFFLASFLLGVLTVAVETKIWIVYGDELADAVLSLLVLSIVLSVGLAYALFYARSLREKINEQKEILPYVTTGLLEMGIEVKEREPEDLEDE